MIIKQSDTLSYYGLKAQYFYHYLKAKSSTPIAQMKPPIVTGAVGGSGTRLISNLLTECGVNLGPWVKPDSKDSRAFQYFFSNYFQEMYMTIERGDTFSEPLMQSFFEAIQVHRNGMSDDAIWGWKQPRNIWSLPLFLTTFPDLKFIHLVRDGRDMAFSSNKSLLRDYGHMLLKTHYIESVVDARLELWEKTQRHIHEFSQKHLKPSHYLAIKYEDLCLNPKATLPALLDFIDYPYQEQTVDQLSAVIKPSSGIGRWQTADESLNLTDEVKEMLSLYQYEV